jgi:hypothetical protein
LLQNAGEQNCHIPYGQLTDIINDFNLCESQRTEAHQHLLYDLLVCMSLPLLCLVGRTHSREVTRRSWERRDVAQQVSGGGCFRNSLLPFLMSLSHQRWKQKTKVSLVGCIWNKNALKLIKFRHNDPPKDVRIK